MNYSWRLSREDELLVIHLFSELAQAVSNLLSAVVAQCILLIGRLRRSRILQHALLHLLGFLGIKRGCLVLLRLCRFVVLLPWIGGLIIRLGGRGAIAGNFRGWIASFRKVEVFQSATAINDDAIGVHCP